MMQAQLLAPRIRFMSLHAPTIDALSAEFADLPNVACERGDVRDLPIAPGTMFLSPAMMMVEVSLDDEEGLYCDMCRTTKVDVAVLSMDGSNGEYGSASVCEPCVASMLAAFGKKVRAKRASVAAAAAAASAAARVAAPLTTSSSDTKTPVFHVVMSGRRRATENDEEYDRAYAHSCVVSPRDEDTLRRLLYEECIGILGSDVTQEDVERFNQCIEVKSALAAEAAVVKRRFDREHDWKTMDLAELAKLAVEAGKAQHHDGRPHVLAVELGRR